MRRVLVLNHFAVPRGFPGGTRHVELFGRLVRWDYLIVAANRNPFTGMRQPSEACFATVPVTPHSTNGPTRIINWISFAMAGFFRSILTRRIDVVYASTPHLLAALCGWAIAAIRRKPLVLEVRDLWPKVLVDMGRLDERSVVYRILLRLERFLYRRADHVVVMAEGVVAHIANAGVSRQQMSYIPNAADPADFVPSRGRDELRMSLGFPRFTAIYTGAHGPANGLDLLLDAAAEVADLPIDIVLVGSGVEKDRLRSVAARRGLTNVQFRDAVPKERIPDLLAAADIGLHVLADVPLFRDSISPNKVFDYMAAGLPVITNCPGMVTELVTRSGAGRGVHPQQLATGIRDLYCWPEEELQAAGRHAIRWIETNQSRSAMAGRLESVLDQVTSIGHD